MSPKPVPLPVPFEEPSEPDCPRCPPKGAPAWMATFADIATLLMAFFVLILSFAEFNQPKFKMVAGSLKQSFGVQREVPVVEQPKGTTVLDLKFSPSPDPAITRELTQDTTQSDAPEIKTPRSEDEADGAGQTGEVDGPAEQGTDGGQDATEPSAAQSLVAALQKAMDSGAVKAEISEGEVVMRLTNEDADSLPETLEEAADALDRAEAETGEATQDVLVQGLAEKLNELAKAAREQDELAEIRRAEGQAERSAALAEAELRVALRREVSQGLVTVEQRRDKVVVTVGAGGAFPSGVAELTPEARDVMSRLAFAAMGDASDIVVTGHTDSVPLSPGSPFRDNWGLAAARASAVVRELAATRLVAPDRLTATSRGETVPVADNADPLGRERNRRIEIEITY